jgi:Phytanoyl-CoA dioxygenase (PhyH)
VISDLSHFQTFGFVTLRRFFDPVPLADEIDRVLSDGIPFSADDLNSAGIHFRYVPMMTGQTPASLTLLDRVGRVAAALFGGPVLPTRAKAVRYRGSTPWHTDSASPIASVGIAAYLETLGPENGALRVLPGSHRPELGDAVRAMGAAGMAATELPGHVLSTQPGDVIFFDEHLFHSSCGGETRHQWRADFVNAPVGVEAVKQTRAYFEGLYTPDWDGAYDVDRYPSYGLDWRNSGRPAVAALQELGVFDLAAKQEAFTRSRRDREKSKGN